jgi:hypothetical protein
MLSSEQPIAAEPVGQGPAELALPEKPPVVTLRRLSQESPVLQAGPPPATLAVEPIPWWLRLTLLVLGAFMAAPLVTACLLTPDPYGQGYGTHRQLGLPPCGMVQYFGVRCPSCGMTTAFTWTVRGRLDRAIAANSGGTLLAVLGIMFSPWCLIGAARAKWFLWKPREGVIITLALLILAVTLLDWGFRLLTS